MIYRLAALLALLALIVGLVLLTAPQPESVARASTGQPLASVARLSGNEQRPPKTSPKFSLEAIGMELAANGVMKVMPILPRRGGFAESAGSTLSVSGHLLPKCGQ